MNTDFAEATLNASSTTLTLSENTTVTISGNPGSSIGIDTAGYLLAVIASGSEVQFNGTFTGGGAVWFKQGRFQARNASFFSGIGDIHVSEASQLQLSAATMNITNNFFLGTTTHSESQAALRVGVWNGSNQSVNAVLSGVTTILAEGTKIGFQYSSTLEIQQLTGSGDIGTVNHANGGTLKISGGTGYTGKITLGSGVALNWSSSSATFGGLAGTAGTVAGGSYLNIKDAKSGSTFAGSVGSSTSGVILKLSGDGTNTQSFTGTSYFSSVSVSDTASLELGGTVSVSGETTVTGGELALTGTSTTFTGGLTVSGGTLNVSSGPQTFTGAFTAGENAILALGSVSADSAALSATGNVTLSAGTIFRIDSYVAGAQLVSSSGTLTAADVTSGDVSGMGVANLYIGGYLVNQRGTAVFTVTDNTLVLSSYTTGANYSLVWDGGDDGVWKANGSGWVKTDEASSTSANFQNGDAVTFATNAAEVTIGGAILADTITISENTTFKLASGQNQALSAASITVASGKNLQLEGAVLGTITDGISLDAADSVVTLKDSAPPNGNTISGLGKVVLNQTNTSTAFTISESVFTDGISLEKTGSGTVNLNASQSYTGGTKITEGILGVNYSNALGSGTLTLNGGTLREDSGALSFGNDINVTAASIIDTQGYTMTLTGTISGTGTLTKTGAGTLVLANAGLLNGSSSFSSKILVSAGTLKLGNQTQNLNIVRAETDGGIEVASGATLQIYGASATSETHHKLAKDIVLNDGATLRYYDASQATANSYQYELSGTITVNGTATITNDSSNNWAKEVALLGNLSGSGTLNYYRGNGDSNFNSNGRLIIEGRDNSGFTGTILIGGQSTAVSQGLDLNADLANGTISLQGGSGQPAYMRVLKDATIKGLKGNANSSVGIGNVLQGGAVGAYTLTIGEGDFAGTIEDNGEARRYGQTSSSKVTGAVLSLVKNTAGTLTLSGTTNISGTLSVIEGELDLSGTSSFGGVSVSGGALTLGGSTTLSQSKDSSAFTVSGGTLTFADDLALTLSLTGDGVLGETVKLVDISGSGSVAQTGMSLDIANITYNGKTLSTRITGASFDNSTGLISFEGKALSLTWAGDSSGAGTWDKSTANFTSEGAATAFVDDDDVTFATSGAEVSIAEAVRAEKITISENTTFKLSSTSTKLLSAMSIEVASGKNLQLEGSVLGTITGGINLVAADSVVTLKDSAPPNGNRFYGVGKVVLNQTNTSSTFSIAASVFTGDISLEKIGDGTVNLSVAQTYNGDTTVRAGALNATAALTTAGTLTIEQGASMALSAAGSFGKISVDGALSTSGSGALTSTGALNVGETGVLTLASTGPVSAAQISVDGALSASGTLTSTGTLSVGGTLTSSSTISATQLSGSGTIDLGSAGTLTLSNSGNAKFSNWTGTIKVGANTGVTGPKSENWNCAGATVEFSGASGWLVGWNGGEFSANIKLVNTDSGSAGFLWNNGTSTKQINPIVNIAGDLTGTGTFERGAGSYNQSFVFSGDLSGFEGTFKHTASLNYATLTFGNGGAATVTADVGSVTGTSTIDWYEGALNEFEYTEDDTTKTATQDKKVYFNYSNDVRSDSTITHAILVKQGAGSLTLTGTNEYTGGTTIENGTLVAANASAFGTGTVTAAGSDGVNSVTLKIDQDSSGNALTLTNNISVSSDKTLILQSSNAGNKLMGTISGESGTLTLASGTLEIAGTSSLKLVKVSAGAELNFSGAATSIIDNDDGALVDGGGKLVFSSGTATVSRILLNTWDGGATSKASALAEVSGGVVNVTSTATHAIVLGSGYSTQSHTLTISGGVLNVTAGTTTLGYNSAGTIAVTGGEANLKSVDFGKNSAGGTLEVSNARLNLGTGGITEGTAGTGHVSFGDGATIGALDSWSSAASVGISLAGVVTFDTTKMVASTSGAATEDATDTAGTTITLAGALSGSGTLTKVGAGTLTLSGDNSAYTGGTTIEAGTLVAANASALGAGPVAVDADGKLGLIAGTTVTVSGGIELASGAKIVVDLSNRLSETETFEVTLATNTAISLAAEAALAYSEGAETDLTGYLELKGWNKSGWTSSLAYADNTLTLTMTIPEPSLFGLLAGATALGFSLSSRRRRRKA